MTKNEMPNWLPKPQKFVAPVEEFASRKLVQGRKASALAAGLRLYWRMLR